MGVIAALRGLMRHGGTNPTVRVIGGGVEVSVDGLSVADMYTKQPALRTVVDFLARNIAQLPVKVYRRQPDGGRERVRDSALALLLESPNRSMTRYELIRQTVCDYKLYDFALWAVGRDADSASGWQIRPIPPAWVMDWETADGFEYSRFELVAPGRAPVWVDADGFVVFHGYHPTDPRDGSSAIRALKETIREQMAAQEYRRQAWERGMRITGWLGKPANVEPWTDEQYERFTRSVRESWGRGGENAGGTPLFEDGITYHEAQVNAHEADWARGVQLSREETAAAYHVNPGLIWHSNTQTYASAKDNARALYADTLAPDLEFLGQRITSRLGALIGEDPLDYAEFDINAKMRGSFEEQVSALQAAVGGPWMARAEARDMMNLPRIEGTDELVVPLNVATGGLASPRDADPTKTGPAVQLVQLVGAPEPVAKAKENPVPLADGLAVKGAPGEAEVSALTDVFSRFYSRQASSVSSAIGGARPSDLVPGDGDEWAEWYKGARWISELAEDLGPSAESQAVSSAASTLKALGVDPDGASMDAVRSLARTHAAKRAAQVVESTFQRVLGDIMGLADEDGAIDPHDASTTVLETFERLRESRSERNARSFATMMANHGAEEGAKRSGYECDKVWTLHGSNHRSTHAAMSGERARVGKRFSNGALWPGDSRLSAAETCNCQCGIEIVKTGSRMEPRRSQDVRVLDRQFGKKIGEHVNGLGYTVPELSDPLVRSSISQLIRDTIDNHDEFLYHVDWRGQDELCEAYVKDAVAVIVSSVGDFVTVFREIEAGNGRLNDARALRR